MDRDVPSWGSLLDMVNRSTLLSDDSKYAARWAFGELHRLLGPDWPQRQLKNYGYLPGEILQVATHRGALFLLLPFVSQLSAVAGIESTFDSVLDEIRRGRSPSGWRHLLLQLEALYVLRGGDRTITFEPSIPDSTKKADVLVTESDGSAWIIEARTLSLTKLDLDTDASEELLRDRLLAVEWHHDVHCYAEVNALLEQRDIEQWVSSLDKVASQVNETGRAETVIFPAGLVRIQTKTSSDFPTFKGAVRRRNAWSRLGVALKKKGLQTLGPLPAWLRFDCLDGLFQFTDWSSAPMMKRIELVAQAVKQDLPKDPHIQGVVLSSGCLTSLDSSTRDDDVAMPIDAGIGMRVTIAPGLVRETFVIPLQPSAQAQAQAKVWCKGYASESSWFDEVIARIGA